MIPEKKLGFVFVITIIVIFLVSALVLYGTNNDASIKLKGGYYSFYGVAHEYIVNDSSEYVITFGKPLPYESATIGGTIIPIENTDGYAYMTVNSIPDKITAGNTTFSVETGATPSEPNTIELVVLAISTIVLLDLVLGRLLDRDKKCDWLFLFSFAIILVFAVGIRSGVGENIMFLGVLLAVIMYSVIPFIEFWKTEEIKKDSTKVLAIAYAVLLITATTYPLISSPTYVEIGPGAFYVQKQATTDSFAEYTFYSAGMPIENGTINVGKIVTMSTYPNVEVSSGTYVLNTDSAKTIKYSAPSDVVWYIIAGFVLSTLVLIIDSVIKFFNKLKKSSTASS